MKVDRIKSQMGQLTSSSLACLRSGKRAWDMLAVGLVTLSFCLLNIGNTGFFGDEYNSLIGLKDLGYQLHALPYFILLRAWSALGGQGLEWLRLLSGIMVAAAAAAVYLIAVEVTQSRPSGLLAASLAATSPWLVDQGQNVRFYAFFMLSAALFLWSLLRARRGGGGMPWLWVTLTALLTISSHLLGVLFVLTGIVFGVGRVSSRLRWALLIGGCLLLILVAYAPRLMPDHWLQAACRSLLPLVDSTVGEQDCLHIGRGAVPTTWMKPFYPAYVFLLGNSFYPLDLAVSIPALLLACLALGTGLWHLRRSEALPLLVAWALVPTLAVVVTLDVLAPAGFVSAGPRHVAPAALAMWTGFGGLALSKRRWPLATAVLAVNLVGLAYYHTLPWSFDSRKTLDVNQAVAQAQAAGCTPAAQLVADGRMSVVAQFNLPASCAVEKVSKALLEPERLVAPQVVFWYSATTSDVGEAAPAFWDMLEARGYVRSERWQYGLTVIERHRKGIAPVLADGQFALPWNIPPLAFADLDLPIPSLAVPATRIMGAVVMEPSGVERWELELAQPVLASGLSITSSAFEMGDGMAAGRVQVTFDDGRSLLLTLVQGVHTADWSSADCAKCQVAFSWRKRMSPVGRESYPHAWEDFQARGFATSWRWPEPAWLSHIEVSLSVASGGAWWIWQLAPLP